MFVDINELIHSSKVYIDTSSMLDDRFTGLYNAIQGDGKIYTTDANIKEIKGLSHSNKEISIKAAKFYKDFQNGIWSKLFVEKCDLESGVHADIYIRNRISISRMHGPVFLIAEDKGLLDDVFDLNDDESADGYHIDIGSLGDPWSPWQIKKKYDEPIFCGSKSQEVSFDDLLDEYLSAENDEDYENDNASNTQIDYSNVSLTEKREQNISDDGSDSGYFLGITKTTSEIIKRLVHKDN